MPDFNSPIRKRISVNRAFPDVLFCELFVWGTSVYEENALRAKRQMKSMTQSFCH